MMAYSTGSGGEVLCNVLFQDRESVPANQAKKRTILATLLRNLKAPFGGEKTIVAGANLQYQPVDISKCCTQFRDDRGWFGDKKFTFKDIPFGPQKFAGVRYEIFEQGTSIVPSVIMLAGNGIPGKLPAEVKGIPVNKKADALFFLHTCRLDQRRNDRDIKEGKKFELARYVVNYADGQTMDIPIFAEIDIHEYKQKDAPQQIPGAQLAWTQAYEGAGFCAAAYSKQWLNPRPDVEIKSLDIVYGAQKDRKWTIVVDDDIDPSNITQVLWAMTTRFDPVEDIDLIRKAWSSGRDPMVLPDTGNFNNRILIDACIPYGRLLKGDFPPVVAVSPELTKKLSEKWKGIVL